MHVIIDTKRLLLRNFTINDAQLIFDLNKDPDVIKYTMDPVSDIVLAKKILEEVILPQYALYNHGRWAVHTKSDLSFIGWCGLKARPERNEINLGYRFVKNAWGNGYATEAAYASLNYGFKELHLPRIIGRAMQENIASIKVLEKCGMHYICDEIIDNHPARTYEAIHPKLHK